MRTLIESSAFAFFGLATSVATAQSDLDELDALDELGDGAAVSVPSRPTIDSTVGVLTRVYPQDRGQGLNEESVQYRADIELRHGWGEWSGLIKPWFVADMFDPDTLRYGLLEAYLEWAGTHVGVRLGQFVESWGMVDTFNPLDVLNRRDIVPDPLDPITRGEVGARLRCHLPGGEVFAEPVLSVYYLPLFLETPQPGVRHRFSIASVVPGAIIGEAEEPQFARSQFGGLSFSHQLRTPWIQADVQFLGVRGPARTPVFGISEDGRQLIPEYYGWWMAGMGLRAVPTTSWLSSTTWKVELAYKRPYEIQDLSAPLPGEFFQYAGGLDISINPAFGAHDSVTLTLEYLGEAGPSDGAAQLRLYEHDVVMAGRWEAGDFAETSLEMLAIVDVSGENTRIGVTVSTQLLLIHPDLAFELGGNYLSFAGGVSNVYASLPRNSDVHSGLTFKF